MNLAFRTLLAFAVSCAAALCLRASALPQQEPAGESQQSAIPTASGNTADFEVKIGSGKDFLVRRKGTLEWMPSSKFSEPVSVGFLDGDHKIYVASKVVKPPKAKHMEPPDYPDSERKAGKEGLVVLRVVVDDQGKVRLPTVDASPSPELAKSAVEAVKKWTFAPAKLNGQPVAALIKVEMQFGLTNHGSGLTLDPTHSILTSTAGYDGSGNRSANPGFGAQYCDGSRVPRRLHRNSAAGLMAMLTLLDAFSQER
jgi:TonB family protein